MLKHALDYAAAGWRVFPLHEGDKTPKTPNGCKDATSDTGTIRVWWTKWPGANIGIATGGPFFVLDVDRAGMPWYEDASLPPTLTAQTGGGGRHLFFRMPDGVDVRNSASVIAKGIDIRGTGGYVVAAPSKHASGAFYTWEDFEGDGAPPMDMIEAAPEWLIAQIANRSRAGRAEAEPRAEVSEGSRNSDLFSMAASMRARGMTSDAILGAARAINAATFRPPLDDSEVAAVVASACRYPAGLSPEYQAARDTAADRRARTEAVTPPAPANDDSWRDSLQVGKGGKPLANELNLITAFSRSPEWAGVLGSDAWTGEPLVFVNPPPFERPQWAPATVTDSDITSATAWLNANGINPGRDAVWNSMVAIASYNRFHPVRDWLEGLVWDGVNRIDTWLHRYAGAANTDYSTNAGRMWLIGAVSRVMEPGCKVDQCLILEGRQGTGKSSALRILAGDGNFLDTMPDMRNKDAAMALRGKWIVEFSELTSLTRHDAETAKQFLTVCSDIYRPPYGRASVTIPRQCVFAGTTNDDEYLQDSTGNRRFLPVACGRFDLEALAADRDQIWAEAVTRYNEGERWYVTTIADSQALEVEQVRRAAVDPWQEVVDDYVVGSRTVKTGDILRRIKPAEGTWMPADRKRIARCLRAAGFKSANIRISGKQTRCFVLEEGDDE